MTQRTKTLLLTGTVIPALMLAALPRDAAAESRERIQLAQQQQEPADQKDRPSKRPEGAPGQRPQGGVPGQGPQQPQKGPPPPPPPAAQERRELPKAPPQAQQPPSPPAKGEPSAPPPAKQVQPPAPPAPPATKQVTPPAPPAQQAPPTKQAEPPSPPAKQPPAKQAEPPAPPAPPATKQVTPPAPPVQQTPPAKQAQPPAPAPSAPPAAGAPGTPPATATPTPPAGAPPAQQPVQRGQGQPPAPGQPPAAGAPPAGAPPAASAPPAPGAPPPAAQRPLPPPTTQSGAISPGPTNAQGQQLQRVDQIRNERRETREGDRTFIREPDRTIIREGGRTIIRHNEVDRFRFNARDVRSERQGGETITYVDRPDGTRIVTVVDDDGRLVRRSRRGQDGREVIIIDNRHRGPQQGYYVELPPPVIRIPRERYILETERASQRDIYDVLIAPPVERIDRRYTLDEIRYSPRVRERMSRVDIDTINFESGSWAIAPDQVQRLAVIAQAVQQAIGQNPAEVFLVEGHTDAVGGDDDNLSLSDRRAESVAVALTQQFGVPAENLTTQGYGEQYLKVPSDQAERQNRRVTMRRITPLLTGQNGAQN